MKNLRFLLMSFLLIDFGSQPVIAAGPDAFEFFEEESRVVTASRRPQPVQESPVAVEVITAEEIQTSGAVNLWDLMRFRAGMNVSEGRSVDGNRAIVSVRGFAQEYVVSLQVLVDGRSVYQSLTGGVYWEQLPVQIQDIERIEIVRGPNAALYGSNAGLGVINIITRKPGKKTALRMSGAGGNQGTVLSGESLESSLHAFAYRLSHTYQERAGYSRASNGAVGNDFLHSNKLNVRGDWSPRKETTVEMFAGGSWQSLGLPTASDQRGDFSQDFQSVRVTQTLDPQAILEVTVSRSDLTLDVGPLYQEVNHARAVQYDADTMVHVGWLEDRLNSSSGFSYRSAQARSQQTFPNQGTIINEIYRGFFSQSVRLFDSLSVVGAVSAEHSTAAGMQPAYQTAALYQPWARHGFRASYSVAPTLPSFVSQHINTDASPNVAFIGNPDYSGSRLSSYELGYRGTVRKWSLESTFYYLRIRDLWGVVLVRPSPLPSLFTFERQDSAIARGVESSVRYRWSPGRSVYANYTYEHISSALGMPLNDQATPLHTVNMGAIMDLGYGVTLGANAGYKDKYLAVQTSGSGIAAAPAHTRLDARLGYRPPRQRTLELFLACQNITQSDHVEFADGLTVPRTYQGGLSIQFGGHP